MRSHRPRLLSLAALALAGVLGNLGCTYYTVYSQPRGTVRGAAIGTTSTNNCCGCATNMVGVTSVCGDLTAGLIGQEVFEGQRLELVQYIHPYVQPVEAYPSVTWASRNFYNVEGSLVFYSADQATWVYYWTPPAQLIYVWNDRYPARQYVWGDGCYGTSWYWGGVRGDGFHTYATVGYRPLFPPLPPQKQGGGRIPTVPIPGGNGRPGVPPHQPRFPPGQPGIPPGRPGGPPNRGGGRPPLDIQDFHRRRIRGRPAVRGRAGARGPFLRGQCARRCRAGGPRRGHQSEAGAGHLPVQDQGRP